jgi:hypothetical protein
MYCLLLLQLDKHQFKQVLVHHMPCAHEKITASQPAARCSAALETLYCIERTAAPAAAC